MRNKDNDNFQKRKNKYMKPKPFKVILKTYISEEKTKGGIFLPDKSREQKQVAEIKYLPEIGNDDGLKVGDKVLIPKFAGTQIEYQDEKLLIIDIDDLIAKIDE